MEGYIHFFQEPIAIPHDNVGLCLNSDIYEALPENLRPNLPEAIIEDNRIKVFFALKDELKSLRYKFGHYFLNKADEAFKHYKLHPEVDKKDSEAILKNMKTSSHYAWNCFLSEGPKVFVQADIRKFVAHSLLDPAYRDRFMTLEGYKLPELSKEAFELAVREYLLRT